MNLDAGESLMPWFLRVFLFGLIAWIITGAILTIVDSFGGRSQFQRFYDIAYLLWIGGLAGIAGLLAVRAFRSLGSQA